MKKNLIADYCSYYLFRLVSFFTRLLPLNFSLFLGRRLGDLLYFFDRRHRAIAYANVLRTVADKEDCRAPWRIVRRSYQAFGQNLVEITFIPRIDKKYLEKYISIENKEYGYRAFDRGKGAIFLIVHEGSWELSNIICANLRVNFVLFVRDQGFPKLNALLNNYRQAQGAKIMHKDASLRQLIEELKSNHSVGMTVDQGGKSGLGVDFFGKDASMSTGAVKLALKYDCAIIPIFYTRVKGPYSRVILDQLFTVTRSGDPEKDLRDNLQRLMGIYEKYLRRYPHEYLWTYKIYKHSRQKDILILSDGKVGHLRQSEGASKLLRAKLQERALTCRPGVLEIKYRFRYAPLFLSLLAKFCPKFPGRGLAMCFLRSSLTPECRRRLNDFNPDIIISAGSAVAAANYLLSREFLARSVVLMRPGLLGVKKFDLALIPRHDRPKPGKNTVITEGALNLIDRQYLEEKMKSFSSTGLLTDLNKPCIGLLIGGNSKKFSFDPRAIRELAGQVKKAAQELDAGILVTTSRRTPAQIEEILDNEFSAYPRCKLLVIASRNNNPDVIGAVLGHSDLLIVSPESISMVCEAVSARKYVLVFSAPGLSAKHRRFLRNYRDKGYIYAQEIKDLQQTACRLLKEKPALHSPPDAALAGPALERIL